MSAIRPFPVLAAALSTALIVGGASTATASPGDVADGPALIRIAGTALVTIDEGASIGTGGAQRSESERRVALVADDAVVTLTGDAITQLQTGDALDAIAEVPAEVIEVLDDDTAAGLTSSANGVADPHLMAEVLEAAEDTGTALELVADDLPTAEAAVGTPLGHTLRFALVSLPGMPNPVTSASVSAIGATLGGYWSEASRSLATFTTPAPISYSSSLTCASDPGAFWAESLSKVFPVSTPTLDSYLSAVAGTHIVLVLPPACGASGVATIGDGIHRNGFVSVVPGDGVTQVTFTHEVGHNLGLDHSNVALCTPDSAVAGCSEVEYGDFYDVMGVGISSADSRWDQPTYLNAAHRWHLGAIDAADAPAITLPAGEQTHSWTLDIERVQSSCSCQRVIDPIDGTSWFLEYRSGADRLTNAPFYAGDYVLDFDGALLATQPGIRLSRINTAGGTTALAWELDGNGYFYSAGGAAGDTIKSPTSSIRVTFLSGGQGTDGHVQLTLSRPPSNPTSPVYRFWSPKNQTHFYTISESEKNQIIANYPSSVWTYEGPRYNAYATRVPGSVPLYRFWSPRLSGHFFTVSEQEKDVVIDSYDDWTWTFEGVAYYVLPLDTTIPNTAQVSRFWSPQNQHHFFTANVTERSVVRTSYPAQIWSYEGERFRVPNW